MSIQPILATLENLDKMHTSLLKIAQDKTALIKDGDMAALDELLKGEQAHIAAIHQIERQRQEAVLAYFKSHPAARPSIPQPTISDVIEGVPSDADKKQLTAAKDRLLQTIHELRWQNELNQKMTYQSLQFVNLTLDMIRPQQEAMNYSESEIKGANDTKNISNFDSQA